MALFMTLKQKINAVSGKLEEQKTKMASARMQRNAITLQKLRKTRIRNEGEDKQRMAIAKEKKRIAKAKGSSRSSMFAKQVKANLKNNAKKSKKKNLNDIPAFLR